ncbi:MAG: 3-oxoacyl-[acyl-carrier-protein] reductase [Deltaproteobacteria bacterium]|jgi:3-oxoacyl-[acyl-carrier protein] reductase|nr:3-oxoacyl-[acyl-carrier-protein] reductase [Deltaproteobacteria bacterium]
MDTSAAAVAVVTGAFRGIGKAVAQCLARDGFQVCLTDVSPPEEAASAIKEIEEQGGKARAFRLDVSDTRAVSDFFAAEFKNKAQLAVLVNNAGITRDGFLIRMQDHDFDSVLAVNLRGAFACLREAAKIMSKHRSGRIINISSVSGQMGNVGQINYSAAKAGLIGMTKSAAKELAARNITVNAVAPGFVETGMTAVLSEEVRAAYLEHIPLKRLGQVWDVAEAVAFLASDRASYITGQVLAVNGGMYC